MADSTESIAPAASTTKRGKAASKSKKSKVAPSHPKVSEMVNSAISSLKERGGSSLQAIKKYIGSHYKVDIERLSPFVKKYLKSAVASGALVQTKGKGATGSFRMSASGGKTKEVVKPSKPAKVAPKKPKPAVIKKQIGGKPMKAAKKAAPAAKKPKPKAAKSPKKPKASKPKAPKPKKAKAAAKKTPAKKGGKK